MATSTKQLPYQRGHRRRWGGNILRARGSGSILHLLELSAETHIKYHQHYCLNMRQTRKTTEGQREAGERPQCLNPTPRTTGN